MEPHDSLLSPAQVADALGVSVNTVKRWVDRGVLPAYKTPGKHRRLPLGAVLRLVQRHRHRFPSLDLARLHGVGSSACPDTASQQLTEALQSGDTRGASSLLQSLYRKGMPIEELADCVIAPAMHCIGHAWETERIDVFEEHRATQVCVGALHELRALVEQSTLATAPVAVGGAPEGDHYLLPSLLVQMTLASLGWKAVNLGPHTPIASFQRALNELQPRLMWMSFSYLPDPEKFLNESREFFEQAHTQGVAVVVGGLALSAEVRSRLPHTVHGEGLRQLSEFAAELHPHPRPPRLGRPTGAVEVD